MKTTAILAAFIPLIFFGCHKEAPAEPQEASASAPNPPPAPAEYMAAAKPSPQPEPAPAATPAPEIAPPGVFYLIVSASVETSDGIVGLKPGDGVKEVRPGVYLSRGGQVALRPDQMTNDMGYARQAMLSDQRQQAALGARMAGYAAQATAAENHASATASARNSITESQTATAARNTERQRLQASIEVLRGQLAEANNRIARGNEHRQHGAIVNTADYANDARQIQTQISGLESQLATIR